MRKGSQPSAGASSFFPWPQMETRCTKPSLSEPWDSPTNIALVSQMPIYYGCPSRSSENALGHTKCVAITGPGTFFPGAKSGRFWDASDPLDQSIILAEIANQDIPWTAPVDLDI